MKTRIGEFLKDWRAVEKLTLKDASERTGVPLPTLQRIEHGSAMDAETMWNLMAFLFGPTD